MTSTQPIPGYTLQRMLGRGNSAWVYLAKDARGRLVALKLPFPETLDDPTRAERFANEVRLSLRLRQAHLVAGYDGVPFGPGAFLSMRYFADGTLSGLIEARRIDRQAVLQILSDIAQALVFLHAQQVVHQDVKSQNVYVEEGRAALGDFGATYYVAQGGRPSGSPFYMAPEIYRGEASSFSSDVYSFGVLAYECLAGERPFTGGTYETLMAAHLSRYPRPLSNLVPDLPRPLLLLIERTFAKTPAERPSARELYEALQKAMGREVSTAEQELIDTSAAPDRSQLLGRHSGRTTITPETAVPVGPQEQPERGTWWNPFKRKGR